MRLVIALILASMALGCGGGSNNSQDGGLCVSPSVEYVPGQPGGWSSVCMQPASAEVARTQCGEVTERCDKTGVSAPSLDCVTTPVGNEPATPAKVTLEGFATVFSAGTDSKNIIIKVYDATTITSPTALDGATPIGTYTTSLPASGTPPDADVRACPTEQENKDRKIGCVSPVSAACDPPCEDAVTGVQFCYLKPGETSGTCVDRSRYEPRYSIPNVPTRTPLLMVTTGPSGKDDATWRMLIQENEYISTNAPECDPPNIITSCFKDKAGAAPSFELNVNALSRGDYASIAVAAGLPSGIPAGHGGIAGEVRDCADVRLQNVVVGTYPPAAVTTFFNGNQWNTLPVRGNPGTCRLGLYAALDLEPGKVQVEAVGMVGGQLRSVGWYSALVFPDAVTVVSVNTGKPLPATP